MRVKRILSQVLAGTILLLFTTLVAACGSSSVAAGSTATATPTATNCVTQASGTIQSINGNTLLITTTRGTQIHATYTGNTVFLRETNLTPAGLQEGMSVAVRAVQNPDSSYSAVNITVRNPSSLTFTPGSRPSAAGTASIRPCISRQRPNGRNGQGNFTGGPGGTTSSQNLAGTVGQLNGNTLTVTDASGADYTVQLTSSTQIRTDSTAAASDLQVGKAVTVAGTSDNSGGITARQVLILLRLPNRTNTNTGQ
jgi:uncharacterized protein DUF5666